MFPITWIVRSDTVTYTRPAIGLQSQRPVEVDDLGLLCDEQHRRDSKRCADHAADRDSQAPLLRFHHQRERLCQPVRFLELDPDDLVCPVEPVGIGTRSARFVGAE